MAICYATEHDDIGRIQEHPYPLRTAVNDDKSNKVTLSGTTQALIATIGADTQYISYHADGGFHIAFGEDATTGHMHIPGDGLDRELDVRRWVGKAVNVIQA